HPDVSGAEVFAQREELLRHQGLDRRRVNGGLALAHRLEVQPERDEGLPRARGRRQDHVLAAEQLEQRFLLRGIERQPLLRDALEKRIEDDVAVEGACGRKLRENLAHGLAPYSREIFSLSESL